MQHHPDPAAVPDFGMHAVVTGHQLCDNSPGVTVFIGMGIREEVVTTCHPLCGVWPDAGVVCAGGECARVWLGKPN